MMARIGRWLLLGAAFVVVFLIGLRLTFPMGLVTRIIEAQAEKALDFRYDISIDRTRFSGLSGVKLYDVTIASTAPVEAGEVRLPIRLASVRGSVGLLSLLGDTPRVKLNVRVGDDGEIRAFYGPGEDNPTTIRLEFFEVRLESIPPIVQKVGMPIVGAVSGTIRVDYGEGWRLTGGEYELGVAGLRIGQGVIRAEMFRQFGGELPLVQTDLGNVVFRGPIEGSTIKINEFVASGQDVRINATGELQLRQPTMTSRLDLNLDFQLDGGFIDRAGLGAALGLPEVQRLQVGDGYALSVTGPLQRPSVVPGARRR